MPAALTANLWVVLVFAVGGLLYRVDPDLYYLGSQEDEILEWMTFWAFVLAGSRYARNAAADRRGRGGLPWFMAGLAVFCLLVALEEISWGQRLLGYRAPDYFLARNYQQEFNLHNVIDSGLRRALLLAILAGYGGLAGLAGLNGAARALAQRARIVLPPAALVPCFALAAVVYAWYPLDLWGEWVECAMGLAFLFAARLDPAAAPKPGALAGTRVVALLVVLASLTTLAGAALGSADPRRLEAARREVAALAADFSGPKLRTRCGIHKRLYTFMVEYGQPYLREGEFARVAGASGAAERAAYLLDPWNSPYWVRHQCEGSRAVLFVYSFGPDRQRDSTEWAIRGDDVGALVTPIR